MKLLGLAGALLLAVICYQPSPAAAQGITVGPGGVGIDIGPQRRDYRDRDYDRPRGYYEERREYRPQPRCRTYLVDRGGYTERVRECN